MQPKTEPEWNQTQNVKNFQHSVLRFINYLFPQIKNMENHQKITVLDISLFKCWTCWWGNILPAHIWGTLAYERFLSASLLFYEQIFQANKLALNGIWVFIEYLIAYEIFNESANS